MNLLLDGDEMGNIDGSLYPCAGNRSVARDSCVGFVRGNLRFPMAQYCAYPNCFGCKAILPQQGIPLIARYWYWRQAINKEIMGPASSYQVLAKAAR